VPSGYYWREAIPRLCLHTGDENGGVCGWLMCGVCGWLMWCYARLCAVANGVDGLGRCWSEPRAGGF
jgi:hypothetical protein